MPDGSSVKGIFSDKAVIKSDPPLPPPEPRTPEGPYTEMPPHKGYWVGPSGTPYSGGMEISHPAKG